MGVKLLILDDEIPREHSPPPGKPRPYMWYYLNALKSTNKDLTFQVAKSVEEAKSLLSDDPNQFNLISIDVIMAPSDDMDVDEVQGGTCTGIVFLRWLIKVGYKGNVIILTQRAKSTVKNLVPKDRGAVARIEVFEKMETTPFKLIETISEIGGI